MWWYGRGNSGGSWLPDEKKANMWPGRGNNGGSWSPAFPRSEDIDDPVIFCASSGLKKWFNHVYTRFSDYAIHEIWSQI